MKKQLQADLLLLLVAAFWGGSYLLIKIALEDMGVLNLITLRFVMAFIVAYLMFFKQARKVDKDTLKYSTILGTCLFTVFITMTYGVRYTTVSNAGFLAALAVIIIPILSTIFLKEKLDKQIILSVVMAVTGIGLLTLDGSLSIGVGDILCIICSFLYSLHIILTSKFVSRVDPINLGIFQLGVVGVCSLVATIIFETPSLPQTTASWYSVIILSLFCTGIAFLIQTYAQKHTSSTHCGLIFTMEPVFASIAAYVFIGEVLDVNGYIGAVLLFLSMIIAEIDFGMILRRNKKDTYEKEAV